MIKLKTKTGNYWKRWKELERKEGQKKQGKRRGTNGNELWEEN